MGKYSESGQATVENIVDKLLGDTTDLLVSRFHPRSIILAGSFGRGEATIIGHEGKVEFLSDCEIVLVANKCISRTRIVRNLSSIIAQESTPKFVIRSSIALPVYSLIPIASILWKPTIWNYDLKYGSRMLYGENYIERMPDFKPEQIPVWEGIRLIFNRIAEALRYFPADGNLSTPEQEQETAFWIIKIILACQDALLIATGRYHVSCRMRNELFREAFGQHFTELQEKLPQFASLAAQATNYKLRGEIFWTDTMKLWFDAAEICDVALKYLLHQYMNIDFYSYLELQEKFSKYSILRYMMVLARRFSAKSLILALPSVLRAGGPWVHLVYPAIALVYFSLSRDGTVDRPLLEEAKNTVSLFTRIKPTCGDPLEEWKYLKDEVCNLWYALNK